MGERFQFYVRFIREGKQDKIVAIHDQWCFGKGIFVASKNLMDTLHESVYYFHNMEQYMEEYIRSILTVRPIYNGMKTHQTVHIEGLNYTPERADSDHGCIIIHVKLSFISNAATVECRTKSIEASIFDTDGKKIYIKDLAKKYKFKLPKKIEYFDTLPQESYKELCTEMMRQFDEKLVKKI